MGEFALFVDLKKDGLSAFQSLTAYLASSSKLESLTARHCSSGKMKALMKVLLHNKDVLHSVEALDLSSPDVGDEWKLCEAGAIELSLCMRELENLTSLNLFCRIPFLNFNARDNWIRAEGAVSIFSVRLGVLSLYSFTGYGKHTIDVLES
jgi:hypothetical protein